MTPRKMILFELNEVPFRIIDEYCRRHPFSLLAQRLSQCCQYETFSEDRVLSPWVTWPTVHRGVTDVKHQIHHLGQNLSEVDQEFPPIWKLLVSQGIQAAVFGSLQSYPLPPDVERYAFYIPHAFAPRSECFPEPLSLFQEFNLSMARSSSRNVSQGVPWKLAFRLFTRSPQMGFKRQTLLRVGRHLLSERVKPWLRIRRRTYQVVLAFDIFMKELRRRTPPFATFFTNHVASSMHRYWAAAFPEDYQEFGYEPRWVSRYHDEIDFTMETFNLFFTELVQFVDNRPDYTLWVASSMGQGATVASPVKTQLYLTDIKSFMNTLGILDGEWERRPAMAPCVSVYITSHKVDCFRTALGELLIDEQPLDYEEREGGFFSLSFGHGNLDLKPPYGAWRGKPISFERLGLSNVPIEDQSNTNAYHIPQGVLLIYDPKSRSSKGDRPQVSTIEIAPAILQNFSLKIPPYMATPSLQ